MMYHTLKMCVYVTPHLQTYPWLFAPYANYIFPAVYLKHRILQALGNCKMQFSYN